MIAARARRPDLAGSHDLRLRRAVDRRAGVLQEGDERPRRGGAEVRHDEEVVRQPRQARDLCRPELLRPRLEPRHRHGDQGRRAACRSWATGPRASSSTPARSRARTSSASASPAREGSVDLQLRHVRHVQGPRRPQGRPDRARQGDVSTELPVGLQRRQGLGSGPHRRAGHRLRRLRQEGHRRPQGGQRERHAVRLAGPGLWRAAGGRQRLQGRRHRSSSTARSRPPTRPSPSSSRRSTTRSKRRSSRRADRASGGGAARITTGRRLRRPGTEQR